MSQKASELRFLGSLFERALERQKIKGETIVTSYDEPPSLEVTVYGEPFMVSMIIVGPQLATLLDEPMSLVAPEVKRLAGKLADGLRAVA